MKVVIPGLEVFELSIGINRLILELSTNIGTINCSKCEIGMNIKMSPAQTQRLLDELCVDLGFCLPSGEQDQLKNHPPVDVEAFTATVIQLEGLAITDISRRLYRDVRDCVRKHYRIAEATAIDRSMQ